MKNLALIIILFSSNMSFAASWKKVVDVNFVGNPISCPTNFIGVPKLYPHTVRDFCVMKYEAKLDAYGTAVSIATGTPSGSIDRPTARGHCQALGPGYDMISNDQWQTIAKNIANVASNWSGGVVLSGGLNRGHSDNVPALGLAAVTDDNDPCNGTGETCTGASWDSQKRTHKLSNGNIIWDFSGNVAEWVTNNNTVSNGPNGFISMMSSGDIRQTRYGAAEFCTDPMSSPYCGMGMGTFNSTAGAVYRGGARSNLENSGVFAANLTSAASDSQAQIGFRCIFVP